MSTVASTFLIYRVDSVKLLSKPKFSKYASILLYHVLETCFKPYKAFFSWYTFFSCPATLNPLGCSIKTYSSKYPFKKVDLTSIWYKVQPFYAASANNILIVSILESGMKVLEKYTLNIWVYLLKTSLALYLFTEPSEFNLVLWTHLTSVTFFIIEVCPLIPMFDSF